MAFVDKIQGYVNLGQGLAAQFLGATYAHYRPQSSGKVLTENNMIEELNLSFDSDPTFSHRRPAIFASQIYYGLFDYTNTNIGDYFWDYGQHIFYVSNFEPLKPIELVRCNRTVSVLRPAASSGQSNGYGGDTTPVTLMSEWPCSILSGGVRDRNEDHTPGSVKDFGVTITLPYYTGIEINTYDVIIDDVNRRYVISENERTALGWRLLCATEIA